MSTLADFYDLLMPELPGIDTAMLNFTLVDVARSFCDRTQLWEVDFTPITTVSGQATYALTTGVTTAEPVTVKRLSVGGALLWDRTNQKPQSSTYTQPKYDTDEPPFQLSADLETITLMVDETPAGTVIIALRGSITPARATATLPDFLRNQHSEAMRFGVLSRLKMMGGKPWTDPALASYYNSEWNSALSFAAYQAAVGNNRQQLRVKTYG